MAPARKSPPGRRTRILLVDDHPLIRAGLAATLQREPDLEVCGEAESRQQALDLIATATPDLAIIDLSLKGSHGLELIKDLRARHPRLAILVVSMHDESLYAERVIHAGARGYLTKQDATKHVLTAVRRVLAGEIYASERLLAQVTARVLGHGRAAAATESLSDRELEVFELMGQGNSTREIAETLHLDLKTIETYCARIKEKLHLKDAADLRKHAIGCYHSGSTGSAPAT